MNILKKVGAGCFVLCTVAASFAQAAVETPMVQMSETSTARLNGLFQAWINGEQSPTPRDQPYRLRRAEMKLTMAYKDTNKIFFMVDPARLIPAPGASPMPANVMLQDLGVSTAPLAGLEVMAGQIKIPTTAEGMDSSSELPLPERSVIGRVFGDRRELGVRANFRQALWNASTMISSGTALNFPTAPTPALNWINAAEWTPVREVGIGGFVFLSNANGNFGYDQRGRWGLHARYRPGNADLRAEYAQGKDGAVQSAGMTTEAGYWFTPAFEAVARFEAYSPNERFFSNPGKAETLGVSYLLRDYNTKLQLAASALQNMSAANGSPGFAAGAEFQLVTFAVQTSI